MTKKAKRTVSMLLAGMLTLYSAAPVAAIDSIDTDANAVLTSADKAALFDVLDYVESQKELFGLGDVDFSELAIGNPISTYEYLETGLEECTPIYPLFYDGEVVAIAKCPEETYFQISTGLLVDSLNEAMNESAALVYDAGGTYLFNGEIFTQISTNNFEVNDRESFAKNIIVPKMSAFSFEAANSTIITNSVDLSMIKEIAALDYLPYSTTQTYYSVSVDYVRQNASMTCWAACIASVSNAVKGTTLTCANVVAAVAQEYGYYIPEFQLEGREPEDIVTDMSEVFDISGYDAYELSINDGDTISDGLILSSLRSNYPSIGRFFKRNTASDKINHAVVICGIHVTSSYLTFMNPSQTEGGFYASYHNGTFFSYEDDNGNLWKLDNVICY